MHLAHLVFTPSALRYAPCLFGGSLTSSRCFYLATSYSLTRKRIEAYALYCHAHSLANDALKKLKSLTTADQVMIKELKMLYDDGRSNSCIEHATGIIEEEKAPENLSKKISTMALFGRAVGDCL